MPTTFKKVQQYGSLTFSWRSQPPPHSTQGWCLSLTLRLDVFRWKVYDYDDLLAGCQLPASNLYYGQNITDIDDNLNKFAHQPNKSLSKYGKELVAKTFWSAYVYKKHDVNNIIINDLYKFIRWHMRGCCASWKKASYYDLVFRATALLKLLSRQRW